jgi:WD40 repeat protein
MAQVFISHASADLETASRVSTWLQAAGHRVFLDVDLEHGLRVGDAWRDRLFEEIHRADAIVCIVTNAFRASPWCAAEVGIAQAYGLRLLPVRAETGAAHPLISRSIQWADLSMDTPDAERTRAKLLQALRTLDATGGGWSLDRSPYPGLRAFDANLARVFFGRKAETRRLAERLRAPAVPPDGVGLMVVVGPSGCGKSSLVRAGLIPTLAGDPMWLVLPPIAPGVEPAVALARSLSIAAHDMAIELTSAQTAAAIAEPDGLNDVAAEILAASSAQQMLLVVDQAEELFTRASSSARQQFVALLAHLTTAQIRIVATLRSDYLDQLSHLAAQESLAVSTFLLAPLAQDLLPQVITGPARQAGIRVDDELAARIAADAKGGEALPLLAFALERLAADAGRGSTLSATLYEQLGGVRGALAGQADAALDAACKVGGRTPGDVLAGLLRLVTVDATGNATRRNIDLAALPPEIRIELEEFINRRLLAVDSDGTRAFVTVTHEHIFSAWPPLAAAIGQATDSLKLRAAVENDADNWHRHGRPASHLWQAGRAEVALSDLDPAAITSVANAFLRAALQHSRRNRFRAIATLATLLLLVTAGGLTAFVQWRWAAQRGAATEQARLVALAEGLIARADATRAEDPRAAMRYGIAAQSIAPGARAQSGLFDSLAATPRLRSSVGGHSGGVRAVALSETGGILATGSDDRTVNLWNIRDPARPRAYGNPLRGHSSGGVRSVAFSPDARLLAAGIDDGTTTLWDVVDPAAPRQVGSPLHGRTRGAVRSMAFPANGGILATVIDDGATILWNVSDPAHSQPLGAPFYGSPGRAVSATFSADGRVLATGNDDGTATLWDVTDPANPRRLGNPLAGHNGTVLAASLSRDGHLLATGGSDRTTILWDVTIPANPQRLGKPLIGHNGGVSSVAFAPDGQSLATSSEDGTAMLWDVRGPEGAHRLGVLRGHTGSVWSVAFSRDGHTLATGSSDRTTILWDVTDPISPRQAGPALTGHGAAVMSAAFSGDGDTLATGSEDGSAMLWDVRDAANPRKFNVLRGHTSSVWSVAFSRDGHTLATGSSDRTTILWDVTDPVKPRRLGSPLEGHGASVVSLAFAGNGGMLASGSDDGTARLWDVRDMLNPRRLGVLRGHTASVWSVAFSPDGRTLATGSGDRTTVLWDIADPSNPRRRGGPLLSHTESVWSVAFSSDGRTLATGGGDRTAILWDVADPVNPRRLGNSLEGHTDRVVAVAFSPDGRILATGSGDRTAILWDVADPVNPRRLGNSLEGHTDRVWSVAFSADGRILATASGDRTTILWNVGGLLELRADVLVIACQRTGGGLSKDEWDRYIGSLLYRQTCPAT